MADDLITRFRAGDRRALARSISLAERGDPAFAHVFDALYPLVGRACRIGITGPPGAGKSTLVSALTRHYRSLGERIGVCAVDPTSPFSGGALLGDRIRMGEHTLDQGVFIRSMATRGSLGGIASATVEVCDLLDAFGFDRVLVETVGVGQSEYDIAEATETVLLVLHPGAGDSVQAMKAGVLEIADVFVINKADLPGADRMEQDLLEMLELRFDKPAWSPPIVRVSAQKGDGLVDLLAKVEAHRQFLASDGRLEARRLRKRRAQVRRMVEDRIRERLWAAGGLAAGWDQLHAAPGVPPPYAAVAGLLARILR